MNVYSEVSENKWKTWLIMVLFILFICAVAYVFGKALGYNEWTFVSFAFIFAGFSSFFSYYFSDKMVLASVGAQEVKENNSPELIHVVENLCIGAGVPMPKVYLIKDPSPNAFATGRDPKHAVVCVTTGLLQIMNKAELEGVIGHELSHVRNFDTRLMGIVAILVGSIVLLADMFMGNLWWGNTRSNSNDRNGSQLQSIFLIVGIIFAILSPVIATLIQLAISRKREYLADASGVLLTRYPQGLASALDKISKDPHSLRTASNATAHLFIANPFKGKTTGAWFSSLFDTHPPIQERIRLLRSM